MSTGRGSVQTGAWINQTKGRVLGATITLDAERSVLLIAFFALFVRLVGSHLWSIICYLVSMIYYLSNIACSFFARV